MGLFGKDLECVGTLTWEPIKCVGEPKDASRPRDASRAKIPGGWLFIVWWGPTYDGSGATFIPDPEHKWDGNSL
jgi:hypothetical protein